MKKQTREEAIRSLIKLWTIIADEGCRKEDALAKMNERDGTMLNPEYNCFACEYNSSHKKNYCGNTCIVSETWGGGHCSGDFSHYDRWLDYRRSGDKEAAKRVASKIVESFKEILEGLKRKSRVGLIVDLVK